MTYPIGLRSQLLLCREVGEMLVLFEESIKPYLIFYFYKCSDALKSPGIKSSIIFDTIRWNFFSCGNKGNPGYKTLKRQFVSHFQASDAQ